MENVSCDALLEDRYRALIHELPQGFALHRVVLDGQQDPVDYIFLYFNKAFEAPTGLRREDIIGRRVTEAIPGIEHASFDWIGTYGRLALKGGSLSFEQYLPQLDRWYQVTAYSDEPGSFMTVFNMLSRRRRPAQEHLLAGRWPNDPWHDVCLERKYFVSNSDCAEQRRQAERQSAGTDSRDDDCQHRCKACPIRE